VGDSQCKPPYVYVIVTFVPVLIRELPQCSASVRMWAGGCNLGVLPS
jgi:hypothetical protein